MTPFEIIISILAYTAIGCYVSNEALDRSSARERVVAIFLWPLVLLCDFILG